MFKLFKACYFLNWCFFLFFFWGLQDLSCVFYLNLLYSGLSLFLRSQMNKSKNLSRKPFVPQTYNRIPPKGKLVDARQKIIAQTRATVIDARSKITQKDARLKLLNNKSSRVSKPRDLRGKLNLRTQPLPVLKPVGIIQRTVRGDDNYLGKRIYTVFVSQFLKSVINYRY